MGFRRGCGAAPEEQGSGFGAGGGATADPIGYLMVSSEGARIHFLSDVEEIGVPVHLFAGSRDRITDVDQTVNWYENLTALTKRLEVLESVGHLNLFEPPHRFVEFMSGVRATVAM